MVLQCLANIVGGLGDGNVGSLRFNSFGPIAATTCG